MTKEAELSDIEALDILKKYSTVRRDDMSHTGRKREHRKHIKRFENLNHSDIVLVKEAIAYSGVSEAEFLVMASIKLLRGEWSISDIDINEYDLQKAEDSEEED